MNHETTDKQVHGELASVLKRFSITYEQHQLLHGPEIGLLARRVLANRKWFGIVLTTVAIAVAIQTGRAFLSGGSVIFWGICCASFLYWSWKHFTKTKVLKCALAAYISSNSNAAAAPGTLADELRLGFSLDYDEHQAIQSGDAELAANNFIQRCRANTRIVIKGALIISLFSVFISCFALASGEDGFPLAGAFSLFVTACAMGFAVSIAIAYRITIGRVEKLLSSHSTPKLDDSTRNLDSDRDRTVNA